MEKTEFYRYTWVEYDHMTSDEEYTLGDIPNPSLVLNTYPFNKETPKGYWIGHDYDKHWISNTSKKKFAYPTKEEAMVNFRKRTEKRIKILERQLRCCKIMMNKTLNI